MDTIQFTQTIRELRQMTVGELGKCKLRIMG